MEDTPYKAKEEYGYDVYENQPKKTFASLFAYNRNPAKGTHLYKIMEQSHIIEMELDEVDDVLEI